jgi:hypothetical protein
MLDHLIREQPRYAMPFDGRGDRRPAFNRTAELCLPNSEYSCGTDRALVSNARPIGEAKVLGSLEPPKRRCCFVSIDLFETEGIDADGVPASRIAFALSRACAPKKATWPNSGQSRTAVFSLSKIIAPFAQQPKRARASAGQS